MSDALRVMQLCEGLAPGGVSAPPPTQGPGGGGYLSYDFAMREAAVVTSSQS